MSRFRQNAAHGELVKMRRAIRDAHEAVDLERAQAVRAARDEVGLLLNSHGRFMAALTVRRDFAGLGATEEFLKMAQRMRDGGYHRVRLYGRRSTDR